jgi:hypothetical protein
VGQCAMRDGGRLAVAVWAHASMMMQRVPFAIPLRHAHHAPVAPGGYTSCVSRKHVRGHAQPRTHGAPLLDLEQANCSSRLRASSPCPHVFTIMINWQWQSASAVWRVVGMIAKKCVSILLTRKRVKEAGASWGAAGRGILPPRTPQATSHHRPAGPAATHTPPRCLGLVLSGVAGTPTHSYLD